MERTEVNADSRAGGREGNQKGYKRGLQTHLYFATFCCSTECCNMLKIKACRRMSIGFHAVDSGSNPLGDAKKIKHLHENVSAFFVVGQICPTLCPTDLKKMKTRILLILESGSERVYFRLLATLFCD